MQIKILRDSGKNVYIGYEHRMGIPNIIFKLTLFNNYKLQYLEYLD